MTGDYYYQLMLIFPIMITESLHIASSRGYIKLVQLLIENKSKLKDKFGRTIIDEAIDNNFKLILKY